MAVLSLALAEAAVEPVRLPKSDEMVSAGRNVSTTIVPSQKHQRVLAPLKT